jgi:hypothetical protein
MRLIPDNPITSERYSIVPMLDGTFIVHGDDGSPERPATLDEIRRYRVRRDSDRAITDR